MAEESLQDDEEMEEPIDEEAEESDEELVDSDDVEYSAAAKTNASEVLEDFSIASRQKVRNELESQIAEFLARGGKINEIEPNVTADPPKKPTPDYGGRPI